MNPQNIRLLYAYYSWANTRLLDAAARAPQEAFLGARLGMTTLRETLTHMLAAEWLWRSRWQGVSPTRMLAPGDFPTFAALRERWADEEQIKSLVTAQLEELGESLLDFHDKTDLIAWLQRNQ
jgi:uncharacterized damage-inducible protein DinB